MATRILSVDYGEARVGLALSDALGITAQPLMTLERRGDKQVCRALAELVADRDVGEIVVGLPLELSGEDGPVTQLVRAFVKRLGNYVKVPIALWDERMSSIAAERALRESSTGRKNRQALVDQVAAVLVLQAYLELRQNQR